MSTVVMAVQCSHCSRFKPPYEIWTMPGNATICPTCFHRTQAALIEMAELMAGGAVNCPVCGKNSDELKIQAGHGDYTMYIHWRDGVFMPHCQQCHDEYAPKRRDLYGKTEFGKTLK